ncbi:galactose-3-O-sulfotransferase 2-like [Saccostrea cucullata]|uniref:galactose-3-O-sulfotransferase 2-like n=1 Tax=Saccostrea cuccullata TaxID=36930 RepID=UPI002ED3DA9C
MPLIYISYLKGRKFKKYWTWLLLIMSAIFIIHFISPSLFTGECQTKQRIISDWSIITVDDDNEFNSNNFSLISDSFLASRRQFMKEEIRHVAFLKVHKTGSSTVTSIIQRFGWARQLNFILPATSPNLFSQNESITTNNILHIDKDETYDILCNHVIYNKQAFQKYLPPDTVYIGIVRDPFDQFVSSVYYYKYRWSVPYLARLPIRYPIKYLLENPNQYEPKNYQNSFTKSRMSVDFGLPEELFHTTDKNKILPYLRKLHSEFKLVMIKEYFDESLILLRRILNWNMKDILYIIKNSSKYVPLRSYRDRYLHKQHSFLDYCLYNFFVRIFWKRVRQQGEDFHAEVSYFRQLRSAVEDFCSEVVKKSALPVQVFEAKENEFHSYIVINKEECVLLSMDEVEFSNKLKWRQFPHLRPMGNQRRHPRKRW